MFKLIHLDTEMVCLHRITMFRKDMVILSLLLASKISKNEPLVTYDTQEHLENGHVLARRAPLLASQICMITFMHYKLLYIVIYHKNHTSRALLWNHYQIQWMTLYQGAFEHDKANGIKSTSDCLTLVFLFLFSFFFTSVEIHTKWSY